MSTETDLNRMIVTDGVMRDGTRLDAVIYPSSPDTGLATIYAPRAVAFTTDDVVALRDFLTLALDQRANLALETLSGECWDDGCNRVFVTRYMLVAHVRSEHKREPRDS